MHTNDTADLVLERLPNGEHALLRPEPEEIRYTITDAGRRALAIARQEERQRFAGPFDPMRSFAMSRPAVRCPACGRGQDTPSCERRERCVGCGVLIDARLVFCSDACGDAYFKNAPQIKALAAVGLTDLERRRLAFVRWSMHEGYVQFMEEVCS